MPKIELPNDFAKEIAKSLSVTPKWVDEWFTVEEDKQGFFVAELKSKKFLASDQFKTMCGLTRDLGGEYVKGMKAFKIPGPLAKKQSDTTSIPTPMDARSKPEPKDSVVPDLPNIKFIPVEAIKIPPFLPTRELISHERLSEITESIKKHGQKYAIKVRRVNSDYELIDGYLRLKSVTELGWKGILAEIKDASDEEVVVESLITNKHRIEEDPITVAKKFNILINTFGYTQEKVAEELGIDRTTISHYTRLLLMPKEIQHSVALHNVSFYHALLLLTVENPKLQVQLANEVVDSGLSTRQLEDRIRELQPKPVETSSETPITTSIASPLDTRNKLEPESMPPEAKQLLKGPSEPEPQIPKPEPFNQAIPCSDPDCRKPSWFGYHLKDERTLCPLCFTREYKLGKLSEADIAPPLPPTPERKKEPEPEPLLTGFEVPCPECHEKILVNHVQYPNGTIRHEVEGE